VAAFTGGWTLDAAESILGTLGDGSDILDALEALVDHSLVRSVEAANGEPRFHLLETIREYAREQLEAEDEVATAAKAHAAYFAAFAELADAGLRGNDQQTWLNRLAPEYPNIQAALRWSIDADPRLCLQLGVAMWWFWDLRGNFAEGRDWLERALERVESAPLALRAAALNGIGGLAEGQSDGDRARAAFIEAIDLRRALGDVRGTGVVLNNLGIVERDLGNAAASEAAWLEAMAIFERLGDSSRVATVIGNLGILARDRGDFVEAARLYETGLAVDREQNDLRNVSADLNNLGLVALHLDELERSAGLFLESLVLKRSFGDRSGIAEVIEGLAGIAGRLGDGLQAARFYGASEAIRTAIGAPLSETELGPYRTYVEEARATVADRRFEAAWEDGRRLDFEHAADEAIRWAEGMPEHST
jgi:tetratricopeptide (TPR) repeat protein